MTIFNSRRLFAGAGLAVVLTAAAITFVGQSDGAGSGASAAAAAPAAIPVSVAAVQLQDVTMWQEFSGRLEAVDRVDLRSRVAGAIQSVNFREGALVRKGDVLVTIDPAPFKAVVAQAEAQVSAAEARVELTGLELDRGRKLGEHRTVSQSDLDQRLSSYHEATAALRSAEAALQSAQLDLDYTQIRAPISGRIGKLQVTAGNLVAAGASSPLLTTLVSVDPIYVGFDVSEEVVGLILSKLPSDSSGQRAIESIPVEMEAGENGQPVRGHLQFIDNRVDMTSGTVQLRAVFDNPDGRLLPGQFVRVRIGQPKPEPQILISERAVGTDQDKKFVLVVDSQNKVDYREVVLGDWANGLRVVRTGLKPGERIIVNGLQHVRPGAVVTPQPVAMASAEQASAMEVAEAQTR
ncbi:efflux RND transporter periplasmic adaptor subunit [Paracoccus alkanivorans]|uniref:Efflux RND transporter periplasmic adaptor subunit n=1 Tax=Paracoccus alkanivorans TaxID=2116655 RepID=A0A3M0MC93_9RHOB|nr:efflux RND transporter periplasmic adaptor subunit [Paracoccus alkanivorans]RMC33904.1 efflux RND transporter periplasmic adaptor subunit [Paracoccus alkanivorans]